MDNHLQGDDRYGDPTFSVTAWWPTYCSTTRRDRIGVDRHHHRMGLGVAMAVFCGALQRAHLNPAVTIGLAVVGISGATCRSTSPASSSAPSSAPCSCTWPTCRIGRRPRTRAQARRVLTGPAIRNYPANLMTEVIGTFVLVFGIFANANGPSVARRRGSAPLLVGFLVWGSACRSAARPATRSTRPATSARGSPTPSCRSRARAIRTGLLLDPGRRTDHRRRPGRRSSTGGSRRRR